MIALIAAGPVTTPDPGLPRVVPNDNRIAAGRFHADTLGAAVDETFDAELELPPGEYRLTAGGRRFPFDDQRLVVC